MELVGAENNFVFESMYLHNYKMHKDTAINFTDAPITVISGANGSGKTQILEALILALGYTPYRVSLGKKSEVIGPFDDHCKIRLKLNNPLISTRRILSSSDPEIIPFVEGSSIELEMIVSNDGTVKRYIISEKGERKKIRQKQLHQLLKSIGIHENSRLNFTEEGSLGAFAEGSPHQKFNTLLRATGMGSIYQSYIEAKNQLNEMQKATSPLKLQLEKELQKLEKFKENYEKATRKNQLLERFKEVERELYWFDVEENTKHQEEVKVKIQTLEAEINAVEKRKKAEQEKLAIWKKQVSEKQTLLENHITQLAELDAKKNQLKGELKAKFSELNALQKQQRMITQDLQDLEAIHSNKGKERYKQIRQQVETTRGKRKEIEIANRRLNEKKRDINAELERLKERKEEHSAVVRSLSKYEMELVRAAVKIKEKIKNTVYESEVLGPVCSVISIKAEYKELESVIKQAIGKHLYGFVAITHQAYEELKKIYDELFIERKPNITVARVLEDTGSPLPNYLVEKVLKDKPNGIIDYVVELIEAPLAVKIYLNRFINIVLAEAHLSTNFLTDYAKQNKVHILTTDGNSYFLPQEAFTRPPMRYGIKLQTDLKHYVFLSNVDDKILELHEELEKIDQAIRTNNFEISNLRLTEKELSVELNKWNLSSDEYAAEIANLEKQLEEINEKIEVYERETEVLEEKINEIAIERNIVAANEQEISEELREIQETIRTKERELEQLKTKSYAFKKDRLKSESLLQQLQQDYVVALEKAKSTGEKPVIMRENKDEIVAEYSEINGQLKLLDMTPNIDEATLKEQERKVQRLEKRLEEDRIHEENLKEDLNKRLKNWETELQKVVNHLNKMLNLLLEEVFEDIYIAIRNYQQAEKAELVISALTKGSKRNYRQLSGGEKTLIGQAIILALHMINQSPIHAIDEFTQKLDKKNRALAFSMVSTIYRIAKENRVLIPQFLLICPVLDDVELSDDFAHKIMIETVTH